MERQIKKYNLIKMCQNLLKRPKNCAIIMVTVLGLSEKQEVIKMTQTGKITALYCRFSADDGMKGDSDSIAHQKDILTEYANNH